MWSGLHLDMGSLDLDMVRLAPSQAQQHQQTGLGGMVGGLVVGLEHGFPLRDGNPSTMLPRWVLDTPSRQHPLESTLIKFYFSKRDAAVQRR